MVETFTFGRFHSQGGKDQTSNAGLLLYLRTRHSSRFCGSTGIPNFPWIVFTLTDFAAVGDGVTVNTEAFERAVAVISKLGKKGGGKLNVLAGNCLTTPFNLTNRITPFLTESAVILGIKERSVYANLGEHGVLLS